MSYGFCNIGSMKNNKILLVAYLSGIFAQVALAQDKIQIRPSVWGTEKWYGGYEFYRDGKLKQEIRPSVWGTERWPGGYEIYKNGIKVGDIKASVWGQEKWYGGYEVEVKKQIKHKDNK